MQQWHGGKETSPGIFRPRNIVDRGGYLPPPAEEWPTVQECHSVGDTMARDTARSMWDEKSRNDERKGRDCGNIPSATGA
jgi:hypothetical protein